MTFEGAQIQGSAKIAEKLAVSSSVASQYYPPKCILPLSVAVLLLLIF